MPKLYIMCGPSGCGKSTWAHKFMEENPQVIYVSRDAIRYSIVAENEEYFKREREVFKQFASTITDALMAGSDVIADATHLNQFSRRKLTQTIDMRFQDYEIAIVVMMIDMNECLARNALREGRAKVPELAIKHMYDDFRQPEFDEDERITEIINGKEWYNE